MKFSELHVHEQVRKGIEKAQFEETMPVQEKMLPHALAGEDVLVQSQTGSGKTAAFLITIFEAYVRSKKSVKAMVIVPTRELAVQIEDDARLLASYIPDIRIATFFGGMGYGKQDQAVDEGVDLFIGTPGRLIDFQSSKKIDFTSLDIVVIDEADRLFDMGFYPDIKKMLKKMRSRTERQTMLFSATLSTRVRHLAWEFMNSPATVEIAPESITVDDIKQELYHVSKEEKFLLLLKLLKEKNPATALIFTNTRSQAVEVAKRLQINGYQTSFLMGDIPQRKRLKIINSMKKGNLRFLVATDVAARGLHINDLELVVNYDLPEDHESYVHRIGRTARAGKTGEAVSFACEQFVYSLEAIESFIKRKIPAAWFDSVSEVEDVSAGVPSRELSYAAKLPKREPSGGMTRKGSRDQGRNRQKKSRAHMKGRKHQPKKTQKKSSAEDMRTLPLEERIAIYKEKYGQSFKDNSED